MPYELVCPSTPWDSISALSISTYLGELSDLSLERAFGGVAADGLRDLGTVAAGAGLRCRL